MNISSDNNGKGQDFELNLASIIDCLTVLITFLLASASFLSIGIFEAGIAAGGESASSEGQTPGVQLTIELKENKEIQLKLTGKLNQVFTFPSNQQTPGQSNSHSDEMKDWNFSEMKEKITSLRSQWPDLKQAILVADNSVEYQEVVKAMENLKEKIPQVYLGGF